MFSKGVLRTMLGGNNRNRGYKDIGGLRINRVHPAMFLRVSPLSPCLHGKGFLSAIISGACISVRLSRNPQLETNDNEGL
jgi:hypothetical protein